MPWDQPRVNIYRFHLKFTDSHVGCISVSQRRRSRNLTVCTKQYITNRKSIFAKSVSIFSFDARRRDLTMLCRLSL